MYYLTVTDKEDVSNWIPLSGGQQLCLLSETTHNQPHLLWWLRWSNLPGDNHTGPGTYYFQWSDDTHDVILDSLKPEVFVTIYDNANCMLTLSATLINRAG